MDATVVESLAAVPLVAAVSNSNTNLSCGSSSSSSNSSGYASATTTPTNPASAGSSSSHSQYSESHSTTPVGMVEPTPVATIAAVTPYYNETFQQQQQQQQQLQQHHSHLQQHQPQPPHQQYPHQTHSYQLTEQLQSPSSSQYNSTYDSYAYLGGGDSYTQSTGVERNLLGMRHTTAFYTALEKPSKLPTQTTTQLHIQTANNSNNNQLYNNISSESILNNQKRNIETSTSAKPQATATPFYAQPLQTSGSTAYLEPYKHKLPTKLPNHNIDYANYSSQQPIDGTSAASYAQYHSGKALQDIAFGTGTSQMKPLGALTNARISQQRLGVHYGSTVMPVGVTIGNATGSSSSSGGGGGTYLDKYDKYLYNAVTTAAQPPFYATAQPANLSAVSYNGVTFATAAAAPSTGPPQYAAEVPNDAYRKASASSSWQWGMDYGNSNCRSLPPPLNGIPTAAIPPTNAGYVPANAAVGASRDMYYTPEKYSSKYDKYNSYYNPHQQYMAANATGRSVWSNSPHALPHLVPALADRLPHSYSHHATLPPSGMPTAIAPLTHPSLAYHHPYPPSAAPVVNRQNCCSQPYQQQNCYYPRSAHHPHFIPNTYNPHIQTTPYGTSGSPTGSGNNNPAAKYGITKVTTNDLYAATPTYDTSNVNYHSYAASVAHNQQYSSSVAPGAVVSHQPLNPNITSGTPMSLDSTTYYNDLNMQPTYDPYMSPIQAPALLQQRRENLVQRVDHLPNLPPPYTQSSSVKSSLIDFRKTSATATEDESFMSETTLTNLDEHMATNMHLYHNNFVFDGEMYSKDTVDESTEKTGTATTPTTKTYSSLRDFLSTWNEDEEDYGCTDERKLSENDSMLMVRQVKTADEPSIAVDAPVSYASDSTEIYRTPQEPLVEDHLQLKGVFNTRPKTVVDHTVDSPMDAETNPYASINLPDIIIDIEKSNGAAPALLSAAKIPAVDANAKSDIKDISYDSFDVEKELDELETKRIKLSRKNPDIPTKRTGSVIMKAESEAHESRTEVMLENVTENSSDRLESIKVMDNFELVNTSSKPVAMDKFEENLMSSVCKSELALSTVQAKPDSSYDRGNESDNTTSSNGSTFEKEYETFINKIGNEIDFKLVDSNDNNTSALDPHSNMPKILPHSETTTNNTKINEEELSSVAIKISVKKSSQSELEIAQKIKCFSKFYKRKRKYSELLKDNDNNKMMEHAQNAANQTNFPMTYTKRCRKRKGLGPKQERKSKTYSFYRRTLRSLRRHHSVRCKRLDTTTLIQKHIATLMEYQLPLMKKFSGRTKNFSKYFNPQTLKCLTVSFINSELFRNNLLYGAVHRKERTERKVIEIAPEKKIEVLEVATDIPHTDQTQENENTEESRTNILKNMLGENEIEDILRNPFTIEAHTGGSDLECNEEVSSQTDADNRNHVDINKVTILSETQSDKSSKTEKFSVDVSEGMEANVFKDRCDSATTEITNDFVEKVKDINRCEYVDVNSPRHFVTDDEISKKVGGVEEIENLELEVSADSQTTHATWNDRSPIVVVAEIKNVIKSSKDVEISLNESKSSTKKSATPEKQFLEAEKVDTGESEVVEPICSKIDDTNRLSHTADLKGFSEVLDDRLCLHSDVIHSPAAEVNIDKIRDAESEIEELTCSTKLDQILENHFEHNVKQFSEGCPPHSKIINGVEVFESEKSKIVNLIYPSKDEQPRLNRFSEDSLENLSLYSEGIDTAGVEVFENKESEIVKLAYSSKDEEPLLSQTEENMNRFREDSPGRLALQSETIDSVDIELIESNKSEIANLACPLKYEETVENMNLFRMDSSENLPLHSEVTNSMAVEIFENKDTEIMDLTYPSKDEKTRLHRTEVNMKPFSEYPTHSESINSSAAVWNFEIKNLDIEEVGLSNTSETHETKDAPTEVTRLVDRDSDLYDTENSVDMFGARKSAEYFTASSKNYFKSSVDFEDNSTDSSSSSSSDSCASYSDRRSTTSSSSSSCSSSDEDTRSSTTTAQSDFNEMKELEKELSQHQTIQSSIIEAKEEEETTETEAHPQDTAGKIVTENDIRTLKQILESDNDGHDEVKTNLENVKKNSLETETIPADEEKRVAEDKEADATSYASVEDDEPLQAEDSVAFAGESDVPLPMEINGCIGTELVKEFAVESVVEGGDKSNEVEYLERDMEIDGNPSQTKYIIAAASAVSGESRVPTLKKMLLDFLERENSIENVMVDRTEDELNSKIPKLSDLCKIALSSSFEISTTTNTNQSVPETLERELSVEEALAEMYRQAGVVSDAEDGDAEEKEAQDIVLINLEEILVNDSDLYVLQCDMNENVLSVVAHAPPSDLPMATNERLGNIADCDENDAAVKDVAQLTNPQGDVKVTNGTTDLLVPFASIDGGVPHPSNEADVPYPTLSHTLLTEFVEGEILIANEQPFPDDALDTQFDLPAIHHEEIVSHDYRRLKRQVLYNSLREKYVLKRVRFRPHHGNRVLKKYIHRWILQCLIARFRERELRKVQVYGEQ